MLREMKAREDGFTVVEIVVTLAIVAILAAIAIPILNAQRKKGDIAAVKEDVVNTALLVEQAKARSGSYSATLPTQAGGTVLKSPKIVTSIVLLSSRNPATACVQAYHTEHTATADRSYYILSEKILKTGVCPTT